MARTRRQRGLARLRRVRRAGCARRAAAGARGAAAVELHAPAGGARGGRRRSTRGGGVPARVLRPLGPREAAAGGAARAKDGKDRRVEARDSMKRALPRYARINTLAHGVTWGHVRRELDRTGHVWWRPSAKEKQTVAGTTLNPEVPKGAGSNVYFRDMHVEDLLVFCPIRGGAEVARA
ncbi:unnamed protein product [Prorocentrum cordatum]|uniref:Uncharacterized protein n=1 Tax=Prorocentrum cordatum TaxID=2364126 RepID=A0ABN9PRN5_9DINO|nr:unnamed protein product [Polarella glacialis]